MNVQIEGKVWVSAHGLTIADAGQSADGGTWQNQQTFIEDLAGVGEGLVEPRSMARSAGNIPVILEILDAEPSTDDFDLYDSVVDAPLRAATGLIRISGDGSDAVSAHVPPGEYRVRVAYANNTTCRYDYADGADHLRVSLWRAPNALLVIHKKGEESDEEVREYVGKRSEADLMKLLTGPSISHRCVAVVALIQLGKLDVVAKYFEFPRRGPERDMSDATLRVFLAAAGFGGAAALPILREQVMTDDDMNLRVVQTLRLIGGAEAKAYGQEIVDGLSGESDSIGMTRDALEDIKDGDDE